MPELRHLLLETNSRPRFFLLLVISGIVSLCWTGLGVLLAIFNDSLDSFAKEWLLLQGFFMVGAAVFLSSLEVFQVLPALMAHALNPRASSSQKTLPKYSRSKRAVVTLIATLGTTSLISLGFNGRGATLYFMWLTAFLVSFLAGFATWHAIEIMVSCRQLRSLPLKVFTYSPAETKELCSLAEYFSIFGVFITVSYVFAFAGTMSANWTGDPSYVRLVQLFWPIIYVPLCIAVLVYPHVVIHRLICREKERLLDRCQAQINEILAKSDLDKEDIERTNSLADFFEKVQKTPNYAVNVQIAFGTATTIAINLGSLLVPREVVGDFVRSYLTAI